MFGTGLEFASPWLLLLGLPLGFVAWRLLRRGRRAGIRFSALARIPAKAAGWRAKVAAMTPYMMLVGLALLVIAVARPRTPLAREARSVDAIAIAMTVDISGSMNSKDLKPSRLEAVKKLFGEFVERRPDDLIGLVTFGGYAATRVPLTADHEVVLHVLKDVETPMVFSKADAEEQLTAVGDGLATALARVKDAKPKSKIVVLLSDGVSNTGAVEPDEAAAAAAKLGVKVYVIGIGTHAVDFWGNPTLDEGQLKKIASKTGGKYYGVDDKDGLEKALEEIDELETTKLEADAYDAWEEHFVWFLLVGAALEFAAVSLSMAAARRMA
jgi:Ca-activated chloride channel homolog